MKRFRLILGGLLGLFLVATPVASLDGMAQDDAYITPTQAKTRRAKAAEERKERLKRLEEKRKKEEAIRKAAEEQYAEEVNDWYNRRDMKVTIEEMEDNLDVLDGATVRQSNKRPKGGKYSQRIRRFGKDRGDVIVLDNVEKVYVLDDYSYDPWSNTYYGRDWGNNINIIISDGASCGWGNPYYSPWCSSYYYSPWASWSYPWYDSWYSPWYDPWYTPGYYGWGYRPYYRGWGFSSPWGSFYSYSGYYPWGYHDSYWNGYYDGRYDGSHRYYERRNYNTYGRSSGGYYDRSQANSEYGRALGSGINARATGTRAEGYYDRGGSSYGVYGNRSGVTSRSNSMSRSWDRNSSQSSSRSNSSSWDYSSGSSTRSSGTSSRSTGSSGSSGSSNSRSSGSSGRTR